MVNSLQQTTNHNWLKRAKAPTIRLSHAAEQITFKNRIVNNIVAMLLVLVSLIFSNSVAAQCTPSNITVSGSGLLGFTGGMFNSIQYVPDGTLNGHPRWRNTHPGYESITLVWSGSRWEFRDSLSPTQYIVVARHSSINPYGGPPCGTTGWTDPEDAGYFSVGQTSVGGACGSNYLSPPTTTYLITGNPEVCSGCSSTLGLTGSDLGTTYRLKRDNLNLWNTTQLGTGGSISFGTQTTAGTYTVVATCDVNSGITAQIVGAVPNNPTPTQYDVIGFGTICDNNALVLLGNSEIGVNYQLKLNGNDVGSPQAGTETSLTFGEGYVIAPGTYTVVATNASNSSVTALMNGSAEITGPLTPTFFDVEGSSDICVSSGGSALISLSGSQTGVNYQLKRDGNNVGNPVPGTGSLLGLGSQSVPGTYTVVALSNGCSTSSSFGSFIVTFTPTVSTNMDGSAILTDGSPTVYNVTGGGTYCPGGSVPFGLDGGELGVEYYFYKDNVDQMQFYSLEDFGGAWEVALEGADIAGVWTLQATNTSTGCSSNMTGSATVTVSNNVPEQKTLGYLGSPVICSGPGSHFVVTSPQAGVSYQLYNGTTAVGTPQSGNGFMLGLGQHSAPGVYSVVASNGSCSITLSSTVTIVNNAITDISNPYSSFSERNNNDTYDTTDDFAYGGITVTYGGIPATGTLTLTSNDIIGSPLSVDVSVLTGNEYTFDVQLKATGAPVNMTAQFSDACAAYTENAVLTAPLQSSRFVFTGNGNFNVAANWQNNNVPLAFSSSFRHITIASGAVAVLPEDDYSYGNFYTDSIVVEPNATWTIKKSVSLSSNGGFASLLNDGTISIVDNGGLASSGSTIYNNGVITVNGNDFSGLNLSNAASDLYNTGTIDNFKQFQLNGATIINTSNGAINNYGKFNWGSGEVINQGTLLFDYVTQQVSINAPIYNSGTLTIEAGTKINYTPGNTPVFYNSGTLNNEGELIFNYSPDLTFNDSSTVNNNGKIKFLKPWVQQSGVFNNNTDGEVIFEIYGGPSVNTGSFINNGTVEHTSGSIFRNENYFFHAGTWNGSGFNSSFENTDSLIVASTGTFEITGDQYSFQSLSGSVFVFDGTINAENNNAANFRSKGVMKGTGSINNADGLIFTNASIGTLQPGNGIGSMSIDRFKNNGTIEFEIAGATPGTQHDQLITDSIAIGGTIKAILVGGFVAPCGSNLDVITHNKKSGTFAFVDTPASLGITYTATKTSMTSSADTAPPSITCPSNVSVNIATGSCANTATWTAPTPTDACGSASIQSVSHASGSSFNLGATTVTYVAVDEATNTASCSFTVTVVDNVAPNAVCQSATIQIGTNGTASLTASQINNNSTDACSSISNISANLTSFNCTNLGSNTVILTVTDAANNTKTCSATVTVTTNLTATAASIATPSICNTTSTNLSFTITGGVSPYSVTYTRNTANTATATAYTSGQAISVSPSTGVYTYALTNVSDANGCSASISGVSAGLTVTVQPTWFADTDNDGYYGTGAATQLACTKPTGFVAATLSGDCGPTDAAIAPNKTEICDGKDNNCDGISELTAACTAPTLNNVSVSGNTATFNWTLGCYKGYRLQYRRTTPANALWTLRLLNSPTTSSTTVTGLTAGTYSWGVKGHCYSTNQFSPTNTPTNFTIGSVTPQTQNPNSTVLAVAYPNPTNDRIFVKVNNSQDKACFIRLTDQMGKTVYGQHHELDGINNCTIPVNDMPNGIYWLQIIVDNQIQTERIVVMR